jgi:hypothetical protein
MSGSYCRISKERILLRVSAIKALIRKFLGLVSDAGVKNVGAESAKQPKVISISHIVLKDNG